MFASKTPRPQTAAPNDSVSTASRRPAGATLHRSLGNGGIARLAEQALAGIGQPVETAARAQAEKATGQDLADVRLHTGTRVRVAARGLGAAAFTIGRDIGVATAPGQPIPHALLVHELVHAAQQKTGANGASIEQAEAQAARAGRSPGGGTGPLASPATAYVACAAEDWLETTPAIRLYGISQLVDELAEVNEWLSRQISSSPEVDRMQEAKAELTAEIARRQRAVREAERPRRRARRRAAAAAPEPADAATATEVPRILLERTSMALTDPEEIRAEVDRIAAWLQRTDLTRADREILRAEMASLAPQLDANLAQASVARRTARLAGAFQPANAGDRTQVVESIRIIESILPHTQQPGMAYVIHRGEMLVFPQELADRVRAETVQALADAARRAGNMISGVEYRMNEHLRLNYEEHPYVGFVVSVVSGEEPVDLLAKVLPPNREAAVALARFRAAQRRGALAEMADAVFTAVEQADLAERTVLEGIDRSIEAAGRVVRGLEITRDLSAAVALSIGAILAAPVVAAGVSGLGITGAGGTALTALGTGTIVGAEGFGIGFTGATLGELASGRDLRDSASAGLGEGVRLGKQGFAIGVGGGTALSLSRSLGVGTAGLTRTGQLWRNVVAQGTGNAVGSATGAALTTPQPGGPGRFEAAWQAGLVGFGTGGFGGVASTFAGGLASPVARFTLGVGAPSVAASGVTYLQTGDLTQSLLSGGTSLAVGSLTLRPPTGGPTASEQWAFRLGQSGRQAAGALTSNVLRTARPYVARAMIGLADPLPALRLDETPGVTILHPSAPEAVPATALTPAPQPSAPQAQQPSAPAIRVSTGARVPGGGQVVTDPFSGEVLGTRSASARTARSLITGIRADVGENAGWLQALQRGEYGLQQPAGANVSGPDFLTADMDAGGQVTLIVTDVKTSTTGRFPTPATTMPATWMAELQAAIAPGRLNLGDPALEAAIRQAFAQGRVRLRQLNADYSPTGGGTVTGF